MVCYSSLARFVRELLTDAEGALALGEIYDAVEEGYPLTDFQGESGEWDEHRFHHEIRAIVNQFMDNDEIVRVGRGMCKKV